MRLLPFAILIDDDCIVSLAGLKSTHPASRFSILQLKNHDAE